MIRPLVGGVHDAVLYEAASVADEKSGLLDAPKLLKEIGIYGEFIHSPRVNVLPVLVIGASATGVVPSSA